MEETHRHEIHRNLCGRHDWVIFGSGNVCKTQAIPQNDILLVDVFIFLGIMEQVVFVAGWSLVGISSRSVKLVRMNFVTQKCRCVKDESSPKRDSGIAETVLPAGTPTLKLAEEALILAVGATLTSFLFSRRLFSLL